MKYCAEYAALLDAYVDGECTPEEGELVRAHLAGCAGCRAYVEMVQCLRRSVPGPEEGAFPVGFTDSVMAAVRSSAAPRRPGRWKKLLLSAAACLAIAVTAWQLPLGLPGKSAAAPSMAAGTADTTEAFAENGFSAPAPAAKEAPVPALTDQTDETSAETSAGTADRTLSAAGQDTAPAAAEAAAPTLQGALPADGADTGGTAPETGTAPMLGLTAAPQSEAGTVPDGLTVSNSPDTPEPPEVYYHSLVLDGAVFDRWDLLQPYTGVWTSGADGGAPELRFPLAEAEYEAVAAACAGEGTALTDESAAHDFCCIVLTNLT